MFAKTIYLGVPLHIYIYTRVDPIIPWSERAEKSAAEQSLVYKNIDFECAFESDFEGDCEAISNQSSDFEGIRIWKARVQKANLKGAPSESRIWKARLEKSESERRAFGKANLKDASSERMRMWKVRFLKI